MATKEKQSVTRVEFDFSDEAKQFLTDLFSSNRQQIESIREEPAIVNKVSKKNTTETSSNEEISLTQIRELIQSKAEEGKTDEIKQLLSKFSAKSASTLSAENYVSFYKQLSKL